VGRKIAELCEVLNIPYWIIDNREEFARKELFPGAMNVVLADFKESFKALPIDEKSSIVIVTYGHKFDGVCLEGSLGTRAGYIGMIGSKRKVKTLLDGLSSRGLDVHDDRIYAPIGLDLGDSTPEEIGISVLSEILKIKSGGTGKHMRDLHTS
jgi:xanthine dehydrogenase accessory factor